jgi:hypothetical protein
MVMPHAGRHGRQVNVMKELPGGTTEMWILQEVQVLCGRTSLFHDKINQTNETN